MTKAELVECVRERTNVRRALAEDAVAAVLDGIKDTLAKGGKVQIVGFGTFEVRTRKARIGRNPQDPNKTVNIPEKKVPVFKAGKLLREAVEPPAPKAKAEPMPEPVAEPVAEKAPAKKTRTRKKKAE